MDADCKPFIHFTGRQRVEKALSTLDGLLVGMESDGEIDAAENTLLMAWVEEHRDVARFHPFSEVIPVIVESLADGMLEPEEVADVRWLCARILADPYFDGVTREIQTLQGVLGGIAADGRVTMAELDALREWMDDRTHLKTLWPFDEVEALRMVVQRDGILDSQEHQQLLAFFAEFTRVAEHRAISPLNIDLGGGSQAGLCAVCPEIEFDGRRFAFTGASVRAKRKEMEAIVQRLGGTIARVGPSLDYLVVGADGNPAWAYACYGRKVEQAMYLRREGARLTLVHETDFWDAVADAG